MTRSKKLFLNSISSLFYQLITLICGFILPHLFLSYYGSLVNGLVSSITQFLGFISLAECGVGAVVQSVLYKPLAEKDDVEISKIYISSERFFRKIAYIFLVYISFLMIIYPFITRESFDYGYTLILILVISLSTFAQYFFGMTYRLLLNADQCGFIQYTIQCVSLILNTVSCIILMKCGVSIQFVKLVTSLIFMIQPFALSAIARRKYRIDKKIVLVEEPIKQKWNGLAQHISAVVLVNTDTVVLTLLSTLENVSIYSVYYLIVNGVKQIITSLTHGMQAMLGNMLAKKEFRILTDTFDIFEWVSHLTITGVYSITAILIIPFVSIYTKDINDANYIVPAFAYLITLAQASYCLRMPYNIMILAAGHYKETQKSAIIEAVINLALSVVLVFQFGLVGIAIGTLVAMTYRTCYFVHYLSKNILHRKVRFFVKHMLVDAISVLLMIVILKTAPAFFVLESLNYLSWLGLAFKVGIVELLVLLFVSMVFYHKKIKKCTTLIASKFKKNKRTV